MIRLLALVYAQANYRTNYLFLAQVGPDGSSVSSINRANVFYSRVEIVEKNSLTTGPPPGIEPAPVRCNLLLWPCTKLRTLGNESKRI